MKERPIIFSGPMVRALLAGTKTQTRRVVAGRTTLDWLSDDGFIPEFVAHPENSLCPYGVPGDRLWVKETWGARSDRYLYRADYGDDDVYPEFRWRPSIHMSRAASRITLELEAVRIERLQAISEKDAFSEGACRIIGPARDAFALLWDDINAKREGCSWEANPWVWVLTFHRLGAS